MFELVLSDGTAFLTEEPTYIRNHENGYVVICRRGDAEGVLYAGKAYMFADGLSIWECDGGLALQNVDSPLAAVLGESASRMQAAEQLRRALQMYASTVPEERALEIASVYPVWTAGRAYSAGDIISFGTNSVGDPQLYRVVQAHTSQADWQPGAGTEALYQAFGLDESGYPVWSQPSGAHDAYSAGDIVNYNGTLYESLIDNNVWSPGEYPQGWQSVTQENPGQ